MSSPPRSSPRLAAVRRALPEHYYGQETLLARLEREWQSQHYNPDRLRRLHENVLVGGRHLALPLEAYDDLEGFGDSNDAWIEQALEIGEQALRQALAACELQPEDVDALFFVSVTGVATPSIEARLMNRMGLPSKMKRYPMFGLGCVAGAAGIARAFDYLRGWPDQVAVLLSVELCSLTLQRQDLSIPNLIASGLFGDGAAACVILGAERARSLDLPAACPAVSATRSSFYRDSEDVMGWRISEQGFRVVLSAEVPEMVRAHLRQDVDAFLGDHGLSRERMARYICHPGGPKVLEAMAEALEIPERALELTWRSLREVGNLSSTSVLLILEDTLSEIEEAPLEPGTAGLLLAMGPGFCSELVLLEW